MIALQVSSSRLGTNILFTHCQKHSVMKQFDIINSETSMNFPTSYSLDHSTLFPIKRKIQIVYSSRYWSEIFFLFNLCSPNVMMELHLKKGKCPVSQAFPCKSTLLSSPLPAPSPKFTSEHCQNHRSWTSSFFPLGHKISISTLVKPQLLWILGRNYFSKKKKRKLWGLWFIHLQTQLYQKKEKKAKGIFCKPCT